MGEQTAIILAAIAAVILLGRGGAACAHRARQPGVVGEVLAGLLVGPLVVYLSTASPTFADAALPALRVLADLGLILFIFLIGLQTDTTGLSRSGGSIVAVSTGSFLLPFGAGTLIGYQYEGSGTQALVPALFLGLTFAVTAFPVLARIIQSKGLTERTDGKIAMASAALTDVVTWVVLVVLVAFRVGTTGWLVLLTLPYVAVLFFLVRPLLRTFLRDRPVDIVVLSVLGAGLILSAAITELIGLHYVIGAFLFGLTVPRSGTATARAAVERQVGPLTEALFLPALFVLAGSQVAVTGLSSGSLLLLGLLLAAAVGSKILGTFAGARAGQLDNRLSLRIALLMNARGLTELIVLDVGRQLGILSDELFAVMVVVAIVTTVMTSPGLDLVDRRCRSRSYRMRDLEPNGTAFRGPAE